MIAQYLVVGIAVLLAVGYLLRSLLASWKTAGCDAGACSGCRREQTRECSDQSPLVQLRLSALAAPPRPATELDASAHGPASS